MHPNLSKSRNRLRPTVEKIRIPVEDRLYNIDHGGETFLDTKITEKSKYYVKDRPHMQTYEVANEGK